MPGKSVLQYESGRRMQRTADRDNYLPVALPPVVGLAEVVDASSLDCQTVLCSLRSLRFNFSLDSVDGQVGDGLMNALQVAVFPRHSGSACNPGFHPAVLEGDRF